MQTNQKENLIVRPPVVVILGQVDVGKTTILDYIRKTHIAETESGGITQHIGAYQVEEKGKKITFIDTPGHEAFSEMRSRGARVADIAVLVVGAGEGVKPQTKEAISHIKKAGIPLIVDINKIDRPGADPARVENQLSKEGILVERLGGNIPVVKTSAVTGKGIDELLDLILILAEMKELKGSLDKPAEGVVIEAKLDSKRGPAATLLIRDGVLKKGDIIATQSVIGKAKIIEDFEGSNIDKAQPSQPVLVLGFEDVPIIGEQFKVFPNVELAEEFLQSHKKHYQLQRSFPVKEEKERKILNLILKTDVLGSAEAIEGMLENIPQPQTRLHILKSGVGDINEADLKLAQTAKAYIIGFRVKIDPVAKRWLEQGKISRSRIIQFDVIYELVQKIRQILEAINKPEKTWELIGKVKVLEKFLTTKNRQILGGKVVEGEIRKGSRVEVVRDEQKIGAGQIINLQESKKNIDKLTKGRECGMLYEGDQKVEKGDFLLVYQRALL